MGNHEWLDIVLDHAEAVRFEHRVREAVISSAQGEQADIASLAVILSGHETVRSLNAKYLEHDYDTDVLAFDLSEEEDSIDGEVYVDLDTAIEYAAANAVDAVEEAARYAVHGTLHLLGYRDTSDEGRAEMRRLEDRYLTRDGD